MKRKIYASVLLAAMLINIFPFNVFASSHREAPLIANDPLADNTDLYAFRCPDDSNHIAIIANYVPLQLPQGGPITLHSVKISVMRSTLKTMQLLLVMILLTVLLFQK